MKRFILLSVLIVSFFGASAQAPRWYYSRPTPGGSSGYFRIAKTDAPFFLKRGDTTNSFGAHYKTEIISDIPADGGDQSSFTYLTSKIDLGGGDSIVSRVESGRATDGIITDDVYSALTRKNYSSGALTSDTRSDPGTLQHLNYSGGSVLTSGTFIGDASGFIYTANGAPFNQGLQYSSDISGTLVNLSLPPKIYVDAGLALRQPLDANLTTLATPGAAGYKVQVNAGGTDYEFAPQIANPATTDEDLLKYNGTGFDRIPVGSNGEVLTVSAGVVGWAAPASGFADPMTTAGDIIIRNAGNTTTRLAVGTSTQFLKGGTAPNWSAVGLTTDVTGILPLANGGTGSSSAIWRGLTGTSTMTGNATDAFGTNTWTGTSTVVGNAYTFNSAFTSNNNNQGSWRINGTITGSATINRAHWSMQLGQALTTGATGQTFSVLQIIPTLNANHANAMMIGIDWDNTTTGAQAASALNLPIIIRDTDAQIRTAGTSHFGDIATAPNSTVHVTGSFSTAYVAKTALYTLTSSDYTVEVTSGTHTQTLPTAVGITGRMYVITNSGSGTVTVGTTSSQTFVNVTATPTTLTLNQFQTVTVQSNGANWLRLSTL